MEDKNSPTILIVDDNEVNIHILFGALSDYDLIPALDGQTALNIIEEEKIDLILLDIMMPNMNGFEVCGIIKNNPKYANIPIIFLTAKTDSDDIKKGFEIGAIDYITKPFNPSELNIRINTHIELISYKNNLEKRVAQEIEENKINQQILFQQSKQAEIGELMMHIAHQWKQPLSELGSINTFQVGKLEHNKTINLEEYKDYLMKNATIISFMSETIETFQNFYQPNQAKNNFNIEDALVNAINIVNATLDYNNINLEIIKDKTYNIFGNINEYSQIILAILNNAKNIFIKREVMHPNIIIKIDEDKEDVVVTIIDNGGGINLENGEDIFSPFVSYSNSTGIGLYMVKAICEKNGWGISTQNYEDGAKFIIRSRRIVENE